MQQAPLECRVRPAQKQEAHFLHVALRARCPGQNALRTLEPIELLPEGDDEDRGIDSLRGALAQPLHQQPDRHMTSVALREQRPQLGRDDGVHPASGVRVEPDAKIVAPGEGGERREDNGKQQRACEVGR